MKSKHGGVVKTLLCSGYHVYSAVWEAAIGELLVHERSPQHMRSLCSLAIRRNEVVIGHSCVSLYTHSLSPCSAERSLSTSLYNSFSSLWPGFARTATRIITLEIMYVLIIRAWNISCWKYFVCLIFVALGGYKNYLEWKFPELRYPVCVENKVNVSATG